MTSLLCDGISEIPPLRTFVYTGLPLTVAARSLAVYATESIEQAKDCLDYLGAALESVFDRPSPLLCYETEKATYES